MADAPLTPPGDGEEEGTARERAVEAREVRRARVEELRETRRERLAEAQEPRERVQAARESARERAVVARENTRERVQVARDATLERVEQARLTTRRLFGLDRSGPPPPQTRRGQALNPWTIPNAIGFARLALIPVFLWLSYRESDGSSTAAAVVYGVIAISDYADGMAARITGQYSRLGALMDPLTDRLLVLAGVVVCFDFELLPRVALVALAVREAYMLGLSRYGLRHGGDIAINWPGRLGVWPTMFAIVLALIAPGAVADAMLWIGLAFSWWAAALYTRDGFALRARTRAERPSS